MASLEKQIWQIDAPSLQAMGYEVARVQLTGGGRPAKRGGATVQIMAERLDRQGMTVEDCADSSRSVSAILDVEDPIRGAYTLEVSSPGIDRPLTRLEHFARFLSFDARVETRFPLNVRKRFRGPITCTSDTSVFLSVDGEETEIPMDEIGSAKLILTDELIAATTAEAQAANERAQESSGGENGDKAQAAE